MLEASSGRVVIKEAEPEVMQLLLQHMYGLEVQVAVQQVAALYQLADQYQVQALLQQLVDAVSATPFQLETLVQLMPKAAALGDTATQLRTQLAQHAASHIADFVLKQPECVKQWGLLEVQLLMQSPAVSACQGLLLAAIWLAGGAERLQHWSGMQQKVQLELLQYEQLRYLQQQQDVLELPGLAAALFRECIRRMDKAIRYPYVNTSVFN
ncbi:hypothetical protein OEZ85_003806 [Tetradesmus obliquus]|uniref:BTB domain-containing protein n=1 Tax=Tetradesmus obliquus TaxID=3088 RepID=A0ABY8UDA8_TETOB|nr:hypothetical protein OEZ85_003806 [Tetradesmus obliquus]